MLSSPLILVASCVGYASGLAITTIPSPNQVASLVRRAAVATITLGPKEQYTSSQVSNNEPSGTSLRILPTGIYDDFPSDGITVSLGPELREQIKEAALKSCNGQGFTQECQNALMSVMPQTDLAAHTKRFLFVAGYFGAVFLGAFIAFVGQTIVAQSTTKEVPGKIRLNNDDVAQIKSMAGASTVAVVVSGASATPVTMTLQPPATSTSPDSITIETLSTDHDDHKAGDVVYRIPKDAAARISDFLAMTGLQETQNICKGQNLRRADTVQECLQHIQRHAMDLADVGPSNLMQIAQGNIPTRPAAGQAIGLPIDNLIIDGIPMLIPVYRVVYEHAPQRPNFDMGWDPLVLVRAATSIAIAAHAAMFVGQSVLEIWIPKDKIMMDLKEGRLVCPKDMLCVSDECQGQKERSNYFAGDVPYCKKVENFGCKCNAVAYGYTYEVAHDYMEKQYEWLDELIKKSTAMSGLKAECDAGFNELNQASKKTETEIETWCKGHEDLKATFHNSTGLDSTVQGSVAFEFGIDWTFTGGDCDFDCDSLFSMFLTDPCISSKGAQKYGVIKTSCGSATYNGYNHKCPYITC